MANTTKILVAVEELTGGAKKGDVHKLNGGEELTAEKIKALGLSNDDIEALKGRGKIVEIDARATETGSKGDNAALKAAEDRAIDAETKVATLTEEVETLKAERDALQTELAKAKQAGN